MSTPDFTINNTWMLISTILVFLMHLGFAALEAGLTRAKNTVNILFKNTSIVAIGLLTYALCGFSLMYPGDFILGDWLGFAGFGLNPGKTGIHHLTMLDIRITLILFFRQCLQRLRRLLSLVRLLNE